MLDDLSGHLKGAKGRDLIRRLNNKRVNQVLPAEMELAIIWAVAQLGDCEIEPCWWPNEKRPDVHTEALVFGRPSIIEIATHSDNKISGEDAMDGVAREFCKFANTVRKGSGDYLYFRFQEESGYRSGRYFRRRLAPSAYRIGDQAKKLFGAWLDSDASNGVPLHILEPGLSVVVEMTTERQYRYFNFWSSMPLETHSINDNPLYELLLRKLDQVKDAPANTLRFIFLADSGSTLLNRVAQSTEIDFTKRRVSGHQIISNFVVENDDKIDCVVVFAPCRASKSTGGFDRPHWAISLFNRPNLDIVPEGLERLASILPLPRFEGYQARSLFRQGSFELNARGWHERARFEFNRSGTMRAKVSARGLLDLLAGRITLDQFRYLLGERPGESNRIQWCLEKGMTLTAVEIEPGGLDKDDDHLVLSFSDDPAARPLRLKDESGEE
ncbi:MAG: hypothetical protein FJX45_17925 [Alphaproteobacteria bacterium]|nr:hypothetical protein [Alphaproteobacteria bacterium]